MLKVFTAIFILFALTNCKSKLAPVAINDITNTRWNYVDYEWNYTIQFNTTGHYSSTHPNDQTPDNDTWTQESNVVTMYSNDAFATFTGTLFGTDSIIGTAVSESETWTYKMYREK